MFVAVTGLFLMSVFEIDSSSLFAFRTITIGHHNGKIRLVKSLGKIFTIIHKREETIQQNGLASATRILLEILQVRSYYQRSTYTI